MISGFRSWGRGFQSWRSRLEDYDSEAAILEQERLSSPLRNTRVRDGGGVHICDMHLCVDRAADSQRTCMAASVGQGAKKSLPVVGFHAVADGPTRSLSVGMNGPRLRSTTSCGPEVGVRLGRRKKEHRRVSDNADRSQSPFPLPLCPLPKARAHPSSRERTEYTSSNKVTAGMVEEARQGKTKTIVPRVEMSTSTPL